MQPARLVADGVTGMAADATGSSLFRPRLRQALFIDAHYQHAPGGDVGAAAGRAAFDVHLQQPALPFRPLFEAVEDEVSQAVDDRPTLDDVEALGAVGMGADDCVGAGIE